MKWLVPLLIFCVGLPATSQDLLVVTSSETKLENLSLFQLRQIYLGRLDLLSGQKITPLQLKPKDPLRKLFESVVFQGKIDLEEYWINQKLRAGPDPPIEISNWSLLLIYVARNPGYIGYIDAERADALKRYNLKVITIKR